jgi:diadenosine tetraphosphatase ApaH/serine/threonine PP2A family protein phosphatase
VRTLIVADVHANLAALRAVIADAEAGSPVDRIWCLGDTVGYGAQPNECIEVLRSYPLMAITGNHDLAAVGLLGTEDFNLSAAEAIEWTARRLNDDARAWLSSLPDRFIDGDFTLVHGALTDPIWDYLISQRAADRHLKLQKTRYGLVGHSHVALTFLRIGRGSRGTRLSDGDMITLSGMKFVANPGSVGQPRDDDPRAAYAIVDTDASYISFHRVTYDIEATQKKIIDAGLPDYLAERLETGR